MADTIQEKKMFLSKETYVSGAIMLLIISLASWLTTMNNDIAYLKASQQELKINIDAQLKELKADIKDVKTLIEGKKITT